MIFIGFGGERVAAATVSERRNPSDLSEVVSVAPEGAADLLGAAIYAARAAQPGWADASPELRSDCLSRVADLLMSPADAIGTFLSREEGKTLPEAKAETMRAARIFRYFAGEALRLHGRSLPSTRPGMEVETRPEALGVVGLITPWNFPIAIPAWKAAPALAFGNAVVLKPAGISGTQATMTVNQEEIFGPVASVIRIADLDEAIAVANDSTFGLSSGIVTRSLANAHQFRRRVQAGMVMVNASTAEDLHYTHANGMVEDKAEVIRRIASGERVYQKVHMIEREVSPQPGFVIVYGKVLMEVSRAAGLLVNQLEYTAVYRDHDPRLLAWQATKSYAP